MMKPQIHHKLFFSAEIAEISVFNFSNPLAHFSELVITRLLPLSIA